MTTDRQPVRRAKVWRSVLLGIAIGLALLAGAVAALRSRSAAAVPPRGGTVDIGFLQSMAQHHDQAIAIAGIVGTRGSPGIDALAAQIGQTQLYETGEMRGWLILWARPTLPADRGMAWMDPKPGQHYTEDVAYARLCTATGGMPGLATTRELEALRRASGPALDTLFLQLMLRHHLSAIPMARFAARNAETPVVATAAASMVREQGEEAAAMRVMLQRLHAPELPFAPVALNIRPM